MRLGRRARDQTRAILDSAHAAFVAMDEDGLITEWNAAAERIFGWPRSEALGRRMDETIVPPAHREAHRAGVASFRARGAGSTQGRRMELTALHRDGHELPIELTLAGFCSRGRWTFVGFALDIAERRAAMAGLRASEERFRLLVEQVEEYAIYGLDPDGRVASWNAGAERMKGYAADEIVGRRFDRFYPPEAVREGRPAALLAAAARDGRVRDEGWRVRKDGTCFWADVVITALRGPEGELCGFSKVTRDRSESRRRDGELRESRRRLADAQAVAGLGSWEWDMDTGQVTWSDELCRIMGFEPGEHPPTFEGFMELVHPEDAARAGENLGEALARGRTEAEHRIVRRDGEVRWVQSHGHAVLGRPDGRRIMSGTLQDVTERRAAEEGLRDSEERFRRTFADAPIGIALVAPDGRWLQVNRALCEMLGYSEAQLLSRTFQDLTHPEDLESDVALLQEVIAGKRDGYQLEKRYRHADGRVVWGELSVSVVRDANGRVCYFVSHVQDITRRKRTESELRHMADHDPLTGLLNRRCFEDELERAIAHARRYGTTGALLVIDLDGFKDVNDAYGHATGDELLRRVAAAMRERLRSTDVLARLGGDEFAAILPHVAGGRTGHVAADIRRAVRAVAVPAGKTALHVTASVGVSPIAPDGRMNAQRLLVEADVAMYGAKESGRDRVAHAVSPPVRATPPRSPRSPARG